MATAAPYPRYFGAAASSQVYPAHQPVKMCLPWWLLGGKGLLKMTQRGW